MSGGVLANPEEEKAVDPKQLYDSTDKLSGSLLNEANSSTFSNSVTSFVNTYADLEATNMVRYAAPFVFTPKLDALMEKIQETAVPKEEEGKKKEEEKKKEGEKEKTEAEKKKAVEKKYAGISKSIAAAEAFAVIVLEELSETPKMPGDVKANAKAAAVDEAYLKDLVAKAKALKTECATLSKTENLAAYDIAKAKALARQTSELVLKVLPMNTEVDVFQFLVARIISQIAISTNTVMTLNKHKKLSDAAKKDDKADKEVAKEVAKILTDVKQGAVKVSCAIRPLTKTLVFRVVLFFTLFMAVVLGIVTVVMSKKADASKHH